MSLKILVTGGTGFIGKELVANLLSQNYQVVVLTRSKRLAAKSTNDRLVFINNLKEAIFDYDIVINLAGEKIDQRWNVKSKKKIYNSRINLTANLVNLINNSKKKPQLFISGSAIGYYGNNNDQFDEDSKVENLGIFSQKLCQDWESQLDVLDKNVRTVKIRIGIVLGKNGGALSKMLPAFRMGLGGKVGDGMQYMSWIHIDDLICAINYIIQNKKINDAVNLTAPKPVANYDFAITLAKILKRPCFFDMPDFIINLLFGEMGKELLCSGQKIMPKKLLNEGFTFKFPKIYEALKDILK